LIVQTHREFTCSMGGRCGWEWGIRFLLAPYQLHPEYIFPPKLRIRPVLDERPNCKRDIKVSKQFPFTIVAVALIAAELRGIYRLVQIFYEPYNNSLLWVTFVPLSAAHKHQRFNDEKCLSPLLILRSPFSVRPSPDLQFSRPYRRAGIYARTFTEPWIFDVLLCGLPEYPNRVYRTQSAIVINFGLGVRAPICLLSSAAPPPPPPGTPSRWLIQQFNMPKIERQRGMHSHSTVPVPVPVPVLHLHLHPSSRDGYRSDFIVFLSLRQPLRAIWDLRPVILARSEIHPNEAHMQLCDPIHGL